jgi:hypothetical protein
MTELENVLMRRDGFTLEEARDEIANAMASFWDYDHIDDFLQGEFGVEPDYIFSIIELIPDKPE